MRLPNCPFVQRSEFVIKYKPFEFYAVAVYLHPILELQEDGDRTMRIKRFVEARCALSTFCGELVEKFLPSAKDQAGYLMKVIDDVVFQRLQGKEALILGSGLNVIQKGIRKFETLVEDEIQKAPIFCLDRIGNLSTESLLDGAHKGYAPEAVGVLTRACKDEIDESGRCLAYERATASGFHILRSVEIAVRFYLLSIPGFVMPPLRRQNWGEYIKLLHDNNAGKVAVDTLHNIKENYRNPLMHPEDTLQLNEAISLFSVCQSMIETLVADMKKKGLI
jgi:hypothetical protein